MRKQLAKAGKTEAELAEQFKELDPVELERGTERLLVVFDALSSARGQGMSGPLPVNHIEIQAYDQLMDEQLTPWEVETLRAMDNAFLEESYALSAKGK